MNIDWLPEPLEINAYNNEVLEELYRLFKRDFFRTEKIVINDKTVLILNMTIISGKEKTFWHLISKGEIENDREIVLERCRKINWIKPIIIYRADDNILSWEKLHKRRNRLKLWFSAIDYLIILEEHKTSYRLVAAYPIDSDRTRNKLNNEYIKNQKSLLN